MEKGRALAGFVLSGLLFALALPASPPAERPCRNPIEEASTEGHTIAVRCDAVSDRAGMVRGPARQLFGLPIDLNCADAPTLEILPGIGTVRARAILDERRIRAFSDVDDLIRVHGIGPKTLERLRPVVGVNSATAGSLGFPECRSNGESVFRPVSGGHG